MLNTSNVTGGILKDNQDATVINMDAATKYRLMSLYADRDDAKNAVEDLDDMIHQSVNNDLMEVAKLGENVGSVMVGNASTDLIRIQSEMGKVGKFANEDLLNTIVHVIPQIAKAGIDNNYPDWERVLYQNLEPIDARKVATAIKLNDNFNDVNAAEIVAGLMNSSPTQIDDTITGIDKCYVNKAGTQVCDDNPIISMPTDKLPDCKNGYAIDYQQCPKPENTSAFSQGVGSGWYKYNEYSTDMPSLIGGLLVVSATEGTPPILTLNDEWKWRGNWCVGVNWNGKEWECIGKGQNPPICAVTGCYIEPIPPAPIPPIPPTTPYPPPIVPPYSYPPYGSTCEVPPGYAILPIPATNCPAPAPINGVPPVYSGGNTIINVPPIAVEVDYPDNSNDNNTEVPPQIPDVTPVSTPCYTLDHPEFVCSILGIGNDKSAITNPTSNVSEQNIITFAADSASEFVNWLTRQIGYENNEFSKTVKATLKDGVDASVMLLKGKQSCSECDSGAYTGAAVRLGLAKKAETETGIPLMYLFQDVVYSMQSYCPQYLPDQSSLDSMYINSVLTEEQYICYTKAQGNLPNLANMNAKLGRTRPTFNDIRGLYLGDVINVNEYETRVKELGIMNVTDKFAMEQSSVTLPSLSDIVLYMVRDAFDPVAVTDGKLDTDFDIKYTEEAEQLGNRQRIPKHIAQLAWRSHWKLPSTEQVYEFVRRLRPGRVNEKVQFTISDAEKLLKQNDHAPGYIDKELAVSYNTLTRTDIKRGYFIDAIDRNEVTELLQDVGYDKYDAEALTNVFDADKEIFVNGRVSRNSLWTVKSAIKAFSNGTLGENDVYAVFTAYGIPVDKWQDLLEQGRSVAASNSRKTCIKGLRNKYLHGAIRDAELKGELLQIGVDVKIADDMNEQFRCDKNSRVKEVAAAKNVTWFSKGVISLDELTNRLFNLGYNGTDAANYINEALFDAAEKARKEAEAKLKQAIKDRKDKEKQDKQDAKDAAAAAKKNNV